MVWTYIYQHLVKQGYWEWDELKMNNNMIDINSMLRLFSGKVDIQLEDVADSPVGSTSDVAADVYQVASAFDPSNPAIMMDSANAHPINSGKPSYAYMNQLFNSTEMPAGDASASVNNYPISEYDPVVGAYMVDPYTPTATGNAYSTGPTIDPYAANPTDHPISDNAWWDPECRW